MTAPKRAPEYGPAGSARSSLSAVNTLVRGLPLGDGAAVEVIEDAASLAGRLLGFGVRMTVRTVLQIGSHAPTFPYPFGLIEELGRVLVPPRGTVKATVTLPNTNARLIRAKGVGPADGTGRVVLYLHGGAFIVGGPNTHSAMVSTISQHADAPCLVVNYRMPPKASLDQAIDDCLDGYRWLRAQGYAAEQIVLAGDSAGGFLSVAVAERLLAEDGEAPAALALISPLIELDPAPKVAHENARTDVMLPPNCFEALEKILTKAGGGIPPQEIIDKVDGRMPQTLVHCSGSEVLLYDARLLGKRLAEQGVPVEIKIWPGQMHVFQVATKVVPEAKRSLAQIGQYIRDAVPGTFPAEFAAPAAV
ncbi:alpha/beta hydrolase [Mycobacteroides abscessus]|uniref:alpha/beta hydrolase n=1 Tax=Mycobacteroides abscessus TaxID=36809 RepID=UPI000C26750E|nr:alpha/beta hydrolase [Mycobacteroides abscessus]PVB26897.1 alpha/beta hydrolase [Mycobacteroides abscessus]RIS43669.1 alpha/beta hydrolase [Mycobacteroides abscessus]RIS74670.1 alpha/beta hydrolase [Mycobacteroides abscessus]